MDILDSLVECIWLEKVQICGEFSFDHARNELTLRTHTSNIFNDDMSYLVLVRRHERLEMVDRIIIANT